MLMKSISIATQLRRKIFGENHEERTLRQDQEQAKHDQEDADQLVDTILTVAIQERATAIRFVSKQVWSDHPYLHLRQIKEAFDAYFVANGVTTRCPVNALRLKGYVVCSVMRRIQTTQGEGNEPVLLTRDNGRSWHRYSLPPPGSEVFTFAPDLAAVDGLDIVVLFRVATSIEDGAAVLTLTLA